MAIFSAGGDKISVSGMATLRFRIGSQTLSERFVLSPDVADTLLCYDWMARNNVLLDAASNSVTINGELVKLKTKPGTCAVRHVVADESVKVIGGHSGFCQLNSCLTLCRNLLLIG